MELEIGVEAVQRPLDFDSLIKLLTTVITLPSQVRAIRKLPPGLLPAPKNPKSDLSTIRPLVLHGEALASHFALATTEWNSTENCRKAIRLVRPCLPVLIVQFEKDEVELLNIAHKWPLFNKLCPTQTGGADVWYGEVRKIPCCLIGPGQVKKDDARKLRICLLRLHAEYQALTEVLRWYERAAKPKLDEEKLVAYLDSVWKMLNRKKRDNLDQSGLTAAISTLAAQPGEEHRRDLRNSLIVVKRSLGVSRFPEGQRHIKPPPSWDKWLKMVKPQPDLTVAISPTGVSDLEWSFFSPHLNNIESNKIPSGSEQGRREKVEKWIKQAANKKTILRTTLPASVYSLVKKYLLFYGN